MIVVPAWADDLVCDQCGVRIRIGEFVIVDEDNGILHEEGCTDGE